MHGKYPLLWQNEVHSCKDRFLDFTGINGAANKNNPMLETQNDERLTTHKIIVCGFSIEFANMDYRIVRFVVSGFLVDRMNKEGLSKERMPRLLGYHLNI